MVTILQIDVDEDLVREGLQYAIAERLSARIKTLQSLVADLSGALVVDRAEWANVWAELEAARDEAATVLDYARAFADQWPEGGEK